MGRFAQVYDDKVKAIVIDATVDGRMSAPACRRALEAGELGGYTGPIPSLELIRLWAKRERHKRQGVDLTDLAKGDLNHGVDQIARRLLAQCDRLTQTLPDDPKTLVDIANVLGKVRTLATDRKPTAGRTQAQKAPASPFTQQLRQAAKRSRSSEPLPENTDNQEGSRPTEALKDTTPTTNTNRNGSSSRFVHPPHNGQAG